MACRGPARFLASGGRVMHGVSLVVGTWFIDISRGKIGCRIQKKETEKNIGLLSTLVL